MVYFYQKSVNDRRDFQNEVRDFLTITNCTANVYGGLRGVCRFSLQYLWKRAVRITGKPYTPQREGLCMLWGNPVIFTDFEEIL